VKPWHSIRLGLWGLVLVLGLVAPLIPAAEAALWALLTVAAVATLLGGLVGAETRRHVRWSHQLVRFCGNPSCGVCRSRNLSAATPWRTPVRRLVA
jgi:hypothetical protein